MFILIQWKEDIFSLEKEIENISMILDIYVWKFPTEVKLNFNKLNLNWNFFYMYFPKPSYQPYNHLYILIAKIKKIAGNFLDLPISYHHWSATSVHLWWSIPGPLSWLVKHAEKSSI